MTRSQEILLDHEPDADRLRPDAEVDDLLDGAAPLHVPPSRTTVGGTASALPPRGDR